MSFNYITEFESALAAYTGARYAVMTDCCTHALELAFRATEVTSTEFTPYTYISIPMMLMKLGVRFEYNDVESWNGMYYYQYTNIWDSARALYPGMYKPGQIMCLSFGHGKPLEIGRGGAILLDDKEAYGFLLQQRYDGRKLDCVPWQAQQVFKVGYHYRPTIEDARIGLEKLYFVNEPPKYHNYPDLRNIQIIGDT